MENDKKAAARAALTKYIEENNCRKTTERFALLDTIYDIEGLFTMEELAERMAVQNFHVSRATLYNSLNLFVKLCLVVRHRFQAETKYEACCDTSNHCYQTCTVCGKVVELDVPEVAKELESVRLKRFRKEYYSVYFYGVCQTCQTRSKRKKNNLKGTKKSNIDKNE